jgi:hypothetical protein
MVKAAQARQRNQRRASDWLALDRTPIGRVLVQRVMNAILVVITNVVPDQTPETFFIHRDDMVEDLASAAADPPFGGSVLPWSVNARPLWF